MRRIMAAVAALTFVSIAFAGRAYWTGKMEFVTTISYKQGVNCQYNFNGQMFWRTFVGSSCPSSVEVQ